MKLRAPMPHQATLLKRTQGSRTLALFWKMRLGKTLVAVRWAQQFKGPRLVVAPLGALHAWRDELSLEGCPATFMTGSLQEKLDLMWSGFAAGHQWYLVNFEGLFKPGHKTSRGKPALVPTDISLHDWNTVIIDESARIRNPKPLTTRCCMFYLSKAPNKAILSGLPNPESELDFVCQYIFLFGHFDGYDSFWDYRHTNCIPDHRGWKWIPRPGVRKSIKQLVRSTSYTLRLRDVGLGNKRMIQHRTVELPPGIQRLYRKAEREYALSDDQTTKYIVVVRNWLSQLAGGYPKNQKLPTHKAKVKEILSLLEEELKDQQMVVWFQYRREAYEVEKQIRAAGYTVRRINGDTPLSWRSRYIEKLQAGSLQILCVQLECGKYALNLSAASVAIYYSLPSSFEQWSQSMERIEHMEKKEPLLIMPILAAGSIDEITYRALRRKRLRSDNILRDIGKELRSQWQERRMQSL